MSSLRPEEAGLQMSGKRRFRSGMSGSSSRGSGSGMRTAERRERAKRMAMRLVPRLKRDRRRKRFEADVVERR